MLCYCLTCSLCVSQCMFYVCPGELFLTALAVLLWWWYIFLVSVLKCLKRTCWYYLGHCLLCSSPSNVYFAHGCSQFVSLALSVVPSRMYGYVVITLCVLCLYWISFGSTCMCHGSTFRYSFLFEWLSVGVVVSVSVFLLYFAMSRCVLFHLLSLTVFVSCVYGCLHDDRCWYCEELLLSFRAGECLVFVWDQLQCIFTMFHGSSSSRE